MIPFIRSINELMLITKAREENKLVPKSTSNAFLPQDSAQKKRYIYSSCKKEIKLPNLNQSYRHKWVRSKKAVSNFLNSLDYNNQIYTSSYDLTLLDIQNNNYKDIA